MVIDSHIKKDETTSPKSSSPKMSSPTPPVIKSHTTQKKSLHKLRFPADLKSPQSDTVSAHKHKHKRTLSQNKSPVLKIGDGIEKLAKKGKSVGDDVAEKLVKKPAAALGAGDGSRSKLIIRIKTKSSKVADQVVNAAGDPNSAVPDDDPDDLPLRKTWKIRPRRLVNEIKNNNVNEGGALKIGGGAALEIKAPEKKEEEEEEEKGKERDKDKEEEKEIIKEKGKEKEKMKKEKMNFSISLKQEEIEDDFLALTGAKPPRRPKKRAKSVQKLLDNVFPSLWLASITPDSYKVNDGTKKLKG